MLIWLPGSKKNEQHLRLRKILAPLLSELHRSGVDASYRSMVDDCFEDGENGVNIWLATELAEVPPVVGTNLLWFLPTLKIMTHVTLLAYDGILTASHNHARFLASWLGDARPIAQARWPVPLTQMHRPLDNAEQFVEVPSAQFVDLPADAEALRDHFRGFACTHFSLGLRERMCGFTLYEELVAVMAGCLLSSDQRSGLPGFLADRIGTPDRAATPDDDIADAERRFVELHAPETIAKTLQDLVQIVQARQRPTSGTGYRTETDQPASQESAFARDAQYILGHPAIATISNTAERPRALALAEPWPIRPEVEFRSQDAPLPWTDLSVTRTLLDAAQRGRVQLEDRDTARIGLLVRALRTHDSALAHRRIDISDLPTVPWQGVAKASQDPKRTFMDLSRMVNGHCLYRFTQRAAQPRKELSPPVANTPVAAGEFLARAAVFFHAFYLDETLTSLTQIAPFLRTVPIYLTTDTHAKQARLSDHLANLGWAGAHFRLTPNVGRDIFPKIVASSDDHAPYDYVLHLHSKRSPHSKSLADWGQNTLAQLAGSDHTIGCIAAAFQADPKLGMVYATPPEILAAAASWTRNLRTAEMLGVISQLGVLPTSDELEFPVGSMFWARTNAIKPLLDAPLSSEHFASEDGQEDGTLAHAIERLLGVVVKSQGFTMRTAS